MKLLTIILIVFTALVFSFDIYGGFDYNFTPDSTLGSFFDISFDVPLSNHESTQFGFSFSFLSLTTELDSFFWSFMTYGRYDSKTSSGIFTVYGKGGAIFPFKFDLSSLGYGVLAGVRYYMNSFFIGVAYEIIYLYDNVKLDIIPIHFGYSF
ncbi:MAG: hypothetical protein H0Z24_04885 [Thermosipho sp. (in: Bacteria)]|nr:hypothetical protein [Thermosipho sp. (in: thermotogales)]